MMECMVTLISFILEMPYTQSQLIIICIFKKKYIYMLFVCKEKGLFL